VIGILGIIEDASRVLKMAFREEGDIIVLLDGLQPSTTPMATDQCAAPGQGGECEFSSSEYSKTISGIVAGEPPAIDLAAERRLQACLAALAAEGTVRSAHDISDGGIAVTLAECCFVAALDLGANVSFSGDDVAEYALFGERGARAVVSIDPASLARLLETARQCGVEAHQIGEVIRDGSFSIQCQGRAVIDSSVSALRDVWAHSLERKLKTR
jgi:phosphoribosylformylglycinamidine synthase subunit PurL